MIEDRRKCNLKDYADLESISLREYLELMINAHRREHELIDIARVKASETIDYRLEQMNHFRDDINKFQQTTITRTEYDLHSKATQLEIKALEKIVYIGLGMVMAIQFVLYYLRR